METLRSRLWNTRVYFLVYAVFITLIISASFFVISLYKKSILDSSKERLEFISRYKAEEINNWIRERKGDARIFSENKIFFDEIDFLKKHPEDQKVKSAVVAYLQSFLRHYNYDRIAITTPFGEILPGLEFTAGQGQMENPVKIFPPGFIRKTEFSDLFYCPQCKSIHLDFYAELLPDSNMDLSKGNLVILRVNPNQFLYPLIQGWPLPSRTSETILIRANDTAIVYLNELRHKKNPVLNLQLPITNPSLPAAMAARGIEGIVIGVDYHGNEVLAAIRKIKDTPWYIISKTDMEEVLHPLAIWRFSIGIFSTLLILAIGAVLMMIIYQRRRDHFKNLYELELQKEVLLKHNEYLLKYASDIILLGDSNHHIMDCNEKAMQVYGYSREEMLRLQIKDLVAPEFLPTLGDRIEKIITEKGTIFESMHHRKDGTIFPIEISARTITVDGNVFIQSIIRDITERKEAEKALIESEAKYRMLFNTMIEGFSLNELIFDENHQPVSYKLIDVNPAFEKLTGLNASEILGKDVLEYLPGLEKEWMEKYFQVALHGSSFSFEQFNQDLNRFFGVTVFRPAENQFAVVFNDITEAHKIQEEIRQLNLELEQRVKDRTAQLESSNKELESFSYSVSHDLRAPLRSLDGFSQALMEDYWEHFDEGGRRYLTKIRAASQKMAMLIDDLLKLSRITRQNIIFEHIDLSNMVKNICQDLHAEKPEREVQFRIMENIQVSGDGPLLKIALENLIHNAWKFSSKKTKAEIEFGHLEKADQVVFFIRDNGSGFDMKYANKLFGVFQRLHTADEFPGTGIGLTTVHRIIHRHGGHIWAESEIDKGTTFFFTLPKSQ